MLFACRRWAPRVLARPHSSNASPRPSLPRKKAKRSSSPLPPRRASRTPQPFSSTTPRPTATTHSSWRCALSNSLILNTDNESWLRKLSQINLIPPEGGLEGASFIAGVGVTGAGLLGNTSQCCWNSLDTSYLNLWTDPICLEILAINHPFHVAFSAPAGVVQQRWSLPLS
jgi:hypothetical protein